MALPPALTLNRDAPVVNSFSTYFSMTGWRLGWVVAPADLVEPDRRLAQSAAGRPDRLELWRRVPGGSGAESGPGLG